MGSESRVLLRDDPLLPGRVNVSSHMALVYHTLSTVLKPLVSGAIKPMRTPKKVGMETFLQMLKADLVRILEWDQTVNLHYNFAVLVALALDLTLELIPICFLVGLKLLLLLFWVFLGGFIKHLTVFFLQLLDVSLLKRSLDCLFEINLRLHISLIFILN